MKRGQYDCPFCGAPSKGQPIRGKRWTECSKCGGRFLVPSAVIGTEGRCVNHPDSEPVGLCSSCGRSFCARCLRVVEHAGSETNLYLCSECTQKHIRLSHSLSALSIVSGTMISVAGILGVLPADVVGYGIVLLFFGICTVLPGSQVLSLEQKRFRDEIDASVTWAECPYCKAGYFYSVHQVKPGWTVYCQNCNRMFKLRDTIPME